MLQDKAVFASCLSCAKLRIDLQEGRPVVADSGASQRCYKAVLPELCAERVIAGVSDGLWVIL
jgi:hypothetical protein